MDSFQGYLITALVTMASVVVKLYYAQQTDEQRHTKEMLEKTAENATLKGRNENLVEENRRLRLELNIASDDSVEALVSMSFDGTIISWSYAAERILGWERREIIGRPVTLLMGREDAAQHAQHVAKFVASGEKSLISHTRVVMANTRHGGQIQIALTVGTMDDARGTTVFYAVIRRA